MTRALPLLREHQEAERFARQRRDDARTAISADAATALHDALKQSIDGEVRFDKGTRALYATDGSNYRQAPIGVVLPRHVQDAETAVRLAREHGAPVLSRGGGTSLAGQCCNVALLLDFSKYMHEVVRIDAARRLAEVQPGCVLDHMRGAARDQAALEFGPDPATHSRCTLGGMLGNNSCGSHSLLSKNNGMGLRTSDNTHALDVLLYDGTRLHVGETPPDQLAAIIAGGGRRGAIYAALQQLVAQHGDAIRQGFPKLERRVSGYNLDALLPEHGFNVARALVGSESTLVTILGATMCLVPSPAAHTVTMLGFSDIYTAAECGLEVLKFAPIACEGIDELLFEYVSQKGDAKASLAVMPKGPAFLLVEFGGASKEESDGQARRMMDAVAKLGKNAPVDMKLYDDPRHEKMLWDVREGGLGSTAWVPGHPDAWPGWEDSAVPVPAVPAYLRALRALFKKYDYQPSIYGHLAQGCIHCRIPFDLYTAEGIAHYRSFMDEAVDLVMSFGGVASGEHGDGQARGQFLPRQFGPELFGAFVDFKRIWDPMNRMNPGKVVNLDGPAYGITDNLRLGSDYNPPAPETHFAFPADQHSFARAALRCVGVGACRREGGGTMCPSYMATREESASTRGRARMLFEMLNGELIDDGWRSDAVKDALDLCFSCKGCKAECPVNVDMATYKSEFLSHYYDGKARPRHAYAFGWIHRWSRLASHAPSLANLTTQLPGFRTIAKWVAGVHPHREIPAFAPQTFEQWFHRRAPVNPQGAAVLLFPDTFNNHFHPDVAIAATEVLEHAGFRVEIPKGDVCCGRPLYDYGFLDMAKASWAHLLETLRPYCQAGTPVVVLEPSCWAAFKDELPNLMPSDEDGKRLTELVFTLSDFLRTKAPHYTAPAFHRRAVVHGHCHQKALETLKDKETGKLFAEKRILEQMGIEDRHPDAGCCGMAGAFGYEKENGHYDVSVTAGERVLLPEVRRARHDDLIIADGFSCREQIEQQTDRTALHMAQVLQLAIAGPQADNDAERPEAHIVTRRERARRAGMRHAAGAVFVGALVVAAIVAALVVR